MDSFAELSEADFAKLVEEAAYGAELEDIPPNYCVACRIPMVQTNCEYSCSNCGSIIEMEPIDHKEFREAGSSTIRISTGTNKGRCYNVSGDYSVTQKHAIISLLRANQNAYKGDRLLHSVLEDAATKYNELQKHVQKDVVDSEGNVVGKKKFVHRSAIKDEILAALIHYYYRVAGLPRKKRDIANFMKLPTDGFSKGESIIQDLLGRGLIELPTIKETSRGFAVRYLDALDVDDNEQLQRYTDFVVELVDTSEKLHIAKRKQLSSKVAGAIHILNTHLKVGWDDALIEDAVDRTRKTTYTAAADAIMKSASKFRAVFAKYQIPYERTR